jgi:hypothetical protein
MLIVYSWLFAGDTPSEDIHRLWLSALAAGLLTFYDDETHDSHFVFNTRMSRLGLE